MVKGSPPRNPRILRLVHLDSLSTLLARQGLHAASFLPDDGLPYRSIHDAEIQTARHACPIPCGPGGVITDYVPFYFGHRSPMLYRLHTGWVRGYDEGQRPLLYLVSRVGAIQQAHLPFVFSDGHGLARFSRWFDDLEQLDQVDWEATYASYWADDESDRDRERRKQAEFLIHRTCPWSVIQGIVVIDQQIEQRVEEIFSGHPSELQRKVVVYPQWYY